MPESSQPGRAPGSAPACSIEEWRYPLGPFDNPARGALHGTGALLGLTGTAWLLSGQTAVAVTPGLAVFALTQCLLFVTSTLYHAVPWPPALKATMQRVDHAMIYVAVAGIVSALASISLTGVDRSILITVVWAVALAGAAEKLLIPVHRPRFSVPIQIGLGFLAVPALPAFHARFPGTPSLLLAVATASFAVGVTCWITGRPRLWPRVFSYHEVFHAFTLLGSASLCALFTGACAQG